MRLIDADELRNELTGICSNKVNDYNKTVKAFIEFIDNAPTVIPSLKLENITEDDIEKFKMIWQRATSKGLPLISEDVLYREETCDRKTHCTDYEYYHCIGCNGCKHSEVNNE